MYRVHLEVDKFSSGEGDDHLTLVDRTTHDVLLSGRAPLVHSLVGANVTDSFRVDLKTNKILQLITVFRV